MKVAGCVLGIKFIQRHLAAKNIGNDIPVNTKCHSDDRMEEESRGHPRVHFPLCSRDFSLRSE